MSQRRTTSKETKTMSEETEAPKPDAVAGRLDGLVMRQAAPYRLQMLPLFSLGSQEPLRLARIEADPCYTPLPTYKEYQPYNEKLRRDP